MKKRAHSKRSDFVVANPPFSTKSWMSGFDPIANDIYNRFAFGIPPRKNGDYAFLLHILGVPQEHRKRGGNSAARRALSRQFRRSFACEIVKRGLIKGIIGLPANLFYGTGIPACIVVVDKEHAAARKGIFMIDASNGFIKDGPKNRLREQDVHRIVDTFTRQVESTPRLRAHGAVGRDQRRPE